MIRRNASPHCPEAMRNGSLTYKRSEPKSRSRNLRYAKRMLRSRLVTTELATGLLRLPLRVNAKAVRVQFEVFFGEFDSYSKVEVIIPGTSACIESGSIADSSQFENTGDGE